MPLPIDHALRIEVNQEVHARPSDPLAAPANVSYLALMTEPDQHHTTWQEVRDLAQRFGMSLPDKPANHFSADLGPLYVRWERHTEFVRYTFIVKSLDGEPFAQPAINAAPRAWLDSLSGQTIVAAHAVLLHTDEESFNYDVLAQRYFHGNVLVGGGIAEGVAVALTDFHIHDGFSRFLILDQGMTTWQRGRMMQRLLEIETYRVMALLALPMARELGPFLTRCEQELTQVATTMASEHDGDETALLERLTRIEASIGRQESTSHYRFGAAAAYYELVQRRIDELRELRIRGLQTFQEFTGRRLAPAMNTCRAAAQRLHSLSERVSRTNQLLSTRIDIARQRQNQSLLVAMNRRGEVQLRLQQTVEGLSVAAITYYIVGLISYAAKGMTTLGLPIHAELLVLISVPIVALCVAISMRRIHRHVVQPLRDLD